MPITVNRAPSGPDTPSGAQNRPHLKKKGRPADKHRLLFFFCTQKYINPATSPKTSTFPSLLSPKKKKGIVPRYVRRPPRRSRRLRPRRRQPLGNIPISPKNCLHQRFRRPHLRLPSLLRPTLCQAVRLLHALPLLGHRLSLCDDHVVFERHRVFR